MTLSVRLSLPHFLSLSLPVCLCLSPPPSHFWSSSRTVLSKLEFPAREHLAIRVVLEALQHREWPASEVMTASPGGDAQISSALLYLRLQPDLDPVLGSSLQRALCAAHECVLSDLAISEVSCDVNINANDVRKDYAYADASIKYEDYADFERYWGKKCSDADRCSDRESCAAVEGVGNSGTVGGAEGKSREWRAQEDVAASDPLKGCSDGRERKASSRFTATAGEAGEGGQDVCEALAKSCKVSLEAGPERKTPADVQSRGGDQQDATPPPATGTAKDGEESHSEKYRSAALDGSRFAPDTKLYVICYDASTSTQSDSVPDCADEAARGAANEKAREAHHVTKVSNENATGAEKTTTDVATETD